jgi:alpha-L-fucosidase
MEGGLIKARSFEADNQASEVTTRSFGLSKAGWKVMDPATGNAASSGKTMPPAGGSPAIAGGHGKYDNAIDDNPSTVWSTLQRDTTATALFPQDISIDMGKSQTIKAFTYLPRQDKKTDGIADRYIIYTSEDGGNWQEAARGEFANIRANPLEQRVPLSHPVTCRYFKFSITHVVSGNGVAVAEVGVSVQ